MKIKNSSLNERGIAHLGLIILIVAVIGVGVFAYMRVSNSNNTDDTTATTSSQTTDDENAEAEDAKALNNAESNADSAVTPTDTQETTDGIQ